jgi:hypothetical protein
MMIVTLSPLQHAPFEIHGVGESLHAKEHARLSTAIA